MKKVLIVLTAAAFLLIPLEASAQRKPKIGITLPANQVDGLYWWHANVAARLQDLLVSELKKMEEMEKNIRKIDVAPGRGDFTSDGNPTEDFLKRISADNLSHAFVWTLTSFERSPAKGGKVKVVLGIRACIVYISSFDIVDARTIEATVLSEDGGDTSNLADTPTGQALKDCIDQIVSHISDITLKKGY